MSLGSPPPDVGWPISPPTGSPPVPGRPQFQAPVWVTPGLSDEELHRLPPPAAPAAGPTTGLGRGGPRPGSARPAAVTIGATLAVSASLQWICALSLAWVTAIAGADNMSRAGEEGALFHLLKRFGYRMVDGLGWPLYLFPAASLVTGFWLLAGRPAVRLAHTALGVAALGWSAWWLRDNLSWWVSPAVYVGVACLLLWTPAANRWYARQRS